MFIYLKTHIHIYEHTYIYANNFGFLFLFIALSSLFLFYLRCLAGCEVDLAAATLTAAVAYDECSRVARRTSSSGYYTRTHKTGRHARIRTHTINM